MSCPPSCSPALQVYRSLAHEVGCPRGRRCQVSLQLSHRVVSLPFVGPRGWRCELSLQLSPRAVSLWFVGPRGRRCGRAPADVRPSAACPRPRRPKSRRARERSPGAERPSASPAPRIHHPRRRRLVTACETPRDQAHNKQGTFASRALHRLVLLGVAAIVHQTWLSIKRGRTPYPSYHIGSKP